MLVKPLGDQAIIVSFGTNPNEQTTKQIQQFCHQLEKIHHQGIIEWVPTFLTVTIYYDAVLIDYGEICSLVRQLLTEPSSNNMVTVSRTVEIPVCYDYGIDLEEVASYHNLKKEEVIQMHSERTYFVYMIGFSPGFPYLGGLNERIATPRKATPRTKVPAGSVGIAGSQTGIYSIDSPGGWQIIGRTPIQIFDLAKEPPVLLRQGDYVKFKPISVFEFERIKKEQNGWRMIDETKH